MISMATHNRLKNGGVPTTLLIAQLLLILFVAYANYLIWIFIDISDDSIMGVYLQNQRYCICYVSYATKFGTK